MEKIMHGRRKKGDRNIVLLYTNKSNTLFNRIRWIALIILAPLWLPFYIFVYFGIWSEWLLETGENLLEALLQLIIPRQL